MSFLKCSLNYGLLRGMLYVKFSGLFLFLISNLIILPESTYSGGFQSFDSTKTLLWSRSNLPW